MRKALIAVALAFTVASVPALAVAQSSTASPEINFDSEKAPNPQVHEDQLTVAEHDRSEMGSPVQYYNDNGEVEMLPATVNQSQEAPVGVRFDQIDASAYDQFPRTSSETGNDATWTIAGNWSTSSGASSSMAVSQADTNGIERVNFDASVASTETATANLTDDIDITSDPNKRVMMAVVNVDELTTGSEVEIRAVDGDGDYRSANISQSDNANATTTIANSTGDGYVFQSKLSEMQLEGSGDGTFDGIQHVEVVVSESDAEVTVSALDLDRKTERDVATVQRDTDDDGEDEWTTVSNYYEGGTANLTGLDGLGPMYDDATIHDLAVYNVTYQFADLTDEDQFSTEFSNSDYSYPQQLELYGDLEVPSAIDLSHGTLTVEFRQGMVNDRYAVAEVATVDSSTEIGNASDSDYSSWTDQLGTVNSTATIQSNANAGDEYRVHMVVLLQDDESAELQDTSQGGLFGPSGGSGGGGLLGGITGWIGAGIASVAGLLGLRRLGGS